MMFCRQPSYTATTTATAAATTFLFSLLSLLILHSVAITVNSFSISFDVSNNNFSALMHKSRLFGSLRPLFAVCPHRSGCGSGDRRSRLATTATAAVFSSRSSSLVTTTTSGSSRRRQYNSHEFHPCRSSSSSSSSSRCFSSTNKEDVQERIVPNDDDETTIAAAAAAAQQWLMYSLPEGYCVGVALLQQQPQQQPSTPEEHTDLGEQQQPTPEQQQPSPEQQQPSSEQQQQQQPSGEQQEQSLPHNLPHRELLHPKEYKWGQTNMISSNSRTSYYLGRIALRLALKRLLLLDDDDVDGGDDDGGGGDGDGLQQQQQQQKQQKLNQKLWEEIITNPIQKDSFGRPILPELVVGSISHKGNYAVGLAAFHHLDQDECKRRVEGILCDREEEDDDDDDDDDYNNKIIRWREDCPIYYNDDGSIITSSSSTTSSSGSNSNSNIDDNNNDGSSNNNINQGRIGIGIDLERIDDTRGDRIQRKVLTKNEQSELGGLVDSCGISIGEEVTLRFSLKESVYKAMHPILCEYVGFQEAEITPLSNGSAKVTLNLQSGSHERLGLVIRSISWRRLDDGFFLTTALVGCDAGGV